MSQLWIIWPFIDHFFVLNSKRHVLAVCVSQLCNNSSTGTSLIHKCYECTTIFCLNHPATGLFTRLLYKVLPQGHGSAMFLNKWGEICLQEDNKKKKTWIWSSQNIYCCLFWANVLLAGTHLSASSACVRSQCSVSQCVTKENIQICLAIKCWFAQRRNNEISTKWTCFICKDLFYKPFKTQITRWRALRGCIPPRNTPLMKKHFNSQDLDLYLHQHQTAHISMTCSLRNIQKCPRNLKKVKSTPMDSSLTYILPPSSTLIIPVVFV